MSQSDNKKIKIEELYSKILKQIENEEIKVIIEGAVIICRRIFRVLIVILFCFIFMPTFKWGWLDRGIMISSVSTIIAGIFGLIAGIIGIVGTYGAFYLGARKEKEKEFKHKKIMLFNLLENTMDETIYLVEGLKEFSIRYGKEIYVQDENEKIYEHIWGLMDKVVLNTYDEDFKFSIGAIISAGNSNILSALPKNKYKGRLQAEFIELMSQRNIKLSRLVYDDIWTTYLDCIEETKDIQDIINWVKLLINNAEGFDVVNFLNYRNEVIRIIDKIYPNVKEGSIRGLKERNRGVIRRIIKRNS